MRRIIDRILRGTLILMMGVLVVNVVWQVFSRYILDDPSVFTDEIARFLLIWVSLLGAAYYSGKNAHIAIDVLPRSLNPPARLKLNILINVIIIAFALCVLVIGGSLLVYYTYTYMQLTPTLQIPMAAVYLIGPLCGLLVIFYKVADIIDMLASQPDEPRMES